MTFDDWAMILKANKVNSNINEVNNKQDFFFFFFFFLQWCRKPSRLRATLAQSNKWFSNPKPKWFPQTKTLRSKPNGGMKGVTCLTWNTGTRAHHHHTWENKRSTRWNDKNLTKKLINQKCQMEGKKTWKTYKREQTNNDTMCSQYSPIKKVTIKCTIRASKLGQEKVCRVKWTKGS